MDGHEAWVYKCLECKHSYKRKNDAETMYCRLRKPGCRFEPWVSKEKRMNNKNEK
ncbi:hypothetical protein SAMN04488579_12434 [Eubacterium barkeri]|uniref:Uncharacterized protein n=1 Tax=Eubacterium barkeri TaxID=1528 RepID=A0A1H3IPQ8_EUBBA|nr:hypothetical protein SAMN04488579_12434 [Eubacterium barkeri]